MRVRAIWRDRGRSTEAAVIVLIVVWIVVIVRPRLSEGASSHATGIARNAPAPRTMIAIESRHDSLNGVTPGEAPPLVV